MMSFPVIRSHSGGESEPVMMTPIMTQKKEISRDKMIEILDANSSWNSYQYSADKNKYNKINVEDKKSKPKKGYSRIHLKEDEVIIEEKKDDTITVSQGKVEGVPTADLDIGAIFSSMIPSDDPPQPPEDEAETDTSEDDLEKEPITPQKDLERTMQSPVYRTSEPTSFVRIAYSSDRQYPSCVNVDNTNTEAMNICVDCLTEHSEADALLQFQYRYSQKLKHQVCNVLNIFSSSVKNKFNRSCHPAQFDDYVKDLICQSCQEKVPPALMMSMMTIESGGDCKVIGDDGRSKGLFQINTTNSMPRGHRVNVNRRCDPSQSQCILNPNQNLKQSIRILKQKYQMTNSDQPANFQCSSSDPVSNQQMDHWRKAVAGYNGGQERIQTINRLIQNKPNGLTQEAWGNMSEWEKIRTYYFSCQRDDVRNCDTVDFRNSISNLAHTEVILGAYNTRQSSSLFQTWNDTAKQLGLKSFTDTSHCQ